MSEDKNAITRLQAYRFELNPTKAQMHFMSCFAGSCRFVYNHALALQQEVFDLCGFHLNYADLCADLVYLKGDSETDWLSDAPSQALQQALKNLEFGWARHFDSLKSFKQGKIARSQMVGKPVFKKKGRHDSFRYPQGTNLEQKKNQIFLPKLGWIKYRNSREVLGTVKNVTVSLSAGKWFISIQTSREVEKPVHPSASAVGIDVGVANFATLSTGQFISALNSFRKLKSALVRAQRRLSHIQQFSKEKYSKNWKKARARVQRVHIQIANARRDYLHKLTRMISQNHAIVCIEDLRIKNMSKSAAGTVAEPGTNVAAKSGLNKAILDQAWGEFFRQLNYKLEWAGGRLISVPPRNTSRTCPACARVSALNRPTQAKFCCIECGYENHADLVGAINIVRAGLARIACEVNGDVMPSAAGTTPRGKTDSTSALAA